mmetsp:Transcript_14811/g.47543  ORF Transcript_14811/g.47543 Transcript_14811/m.47543 type:complete len:403 (+) Transcript_14811:424-1632(+)
MAHGSTGAQPDGAIYTSPSLWLASHPVYSTLLKLDDERWVQFAFKVRVRPNSYKVQRSTLSSSKHWDARIQMDPNMPHNESLEWLIPSSADVLVVGLMLRELGPSVDASVFGTLASRVSAHQVEGPEYSWTALLKGALQSGAYSIDNGDLRLGFNSVEWQLCNMRTKGDEYEPRQRIMSSSFDLGNPGITDCRISWGKTSAACYSICVSFTVMSEQPLWVVLSCGEYCRHILIAASSGYQAWAYSPKKEDVLDKLADSICVHLRFHRANISAQVLCLSVSDNKCFWNIDPAMLDHTYLSEFSRIRSEVASLTISGVELNVYMLMCPRGLISAYREWCEVRVIFCAGPLLATLTYELSLGHKRVKRTLVLQSAKQTTFTVWEKRSEFLNSGNTKISLEIVSLI